MKGVCKFCKFWVGNGAMGDCYRYPKRIRCKDQDWCGEFKQRKVKVKSDNNSTTT
jgi:hypothetical protein